MGFLDFVNMLSIDDANEKLNKMLKGLKKIDKVLSNHNKRLKKLEEEINSIILG